jgi:hypothetical protein
LLFCAEAGRTSGCRGETPRTPPAVGEGRSQKRVAGGLHTRGPQRRSSPPPSFVPSLLPLALTRDALALLRAAVLAPHHVAQVGAVALHLAGRGVDLVALGGVVPASEASIKGRELGALFKLRGMVGTVLMASRSFCAGRTRSSRSRSYHFQCFLRTPIFSRSPWMGPICPMLAHILASPCARKSESRGGAERVREGGTRYLASLFSAAEERACFCRRRAIKPAFAADGRAFFALAERASFSPRRRTRLLRTRSAACFRRSRTCLLCAR